MTAFPLSSPPKSSGIYLLRNRVARLYYVGQAVNLHRRWSEWKSALAMSIGHKSQVVLLAMKDTELADWEFVVVQLCERADLDRLEVIAIEGLRNCCDGTVLNYAQLQIKGYKLHEAKTVIVDELGRRITYADAAEQIGCTYATLSKRLKKRRKNGTGAMLTLAHLKSTSTVFSRR
jgi:hypothetical protein